MSSSMFSGDYIRVFEIIIDFIEPLRPDIIEQQTKHIALVLSLYTWSNLKYLLCCIDVSAFNVFQVGDLENIETNPDEITIGIFLAYTPLYMIDLILDITGLKKDPHSSDIIKGFDKIFNFIKDYIFVSRKYGIKLIVETIIWYDSSPMNSMDE